MPSGLLKSVEEMSARVMLEHRIYSRAEELASGRSISPSLSENHLRFRGIHALRLPPLNVPNLLLRQSSASPIVCVQDDHPAETRISILKSELFENTNELKMPASPRTFDQLLLDKSQLESKLEDLENDIEIWRVKKRRAGTKFLVVRTIVVYQDVAMKTDLYKSVSSGNILDEEMQDEGVESSENDDKNDDDDENDGDYNDAGDVDDEEDGEGW